MRMSKVTNLKICHLHKNIIVSDGLPVCIYIDVLESKGERRIAGQPGFRMTIFQSNRKHQCAKMFCLVTQLCAKMFCLVTQLCALSIYGP